jgi:hypothetical protein
MTASAPVPDEGELRLGTHRWADSFPEPWQAGREREEERHREDMAAPFTRRYPGLARAVDAALAPGVLEAAVRSVPASRIVLVPADRPADVVPVLGWCPGDWVYVFPVPCPVGFAAVLRSREERFGARLFAMTHDEAHLLVERPPRTSSMLRSGTSGGIDSSAANAVSSCVPWGPAGRTESTSAQAHDDAGQPRLHEETCHVPASRPP